MSADHIAPRGVNFPNRHTHVLVLPVPVLRQLPVRYAEIDGALALWALRRARSMALREMSIAATAQPWRA